MRDQFLSVAQFDFRVHEATGILLLESKEVIALQKLRVLVMQFFQAVFEFLVQSLLTWVAECLLY